MTGPLTVSNRLLENVESKTNEKKRLRITANNGRGAKFTSRLKQLKNLSMDVVFEIFKVLLPMDLLNLARTTKHFRRVLLSRVAITIWKAAFANIPELPSCPDELSLPAWANLIFDPHCHECQCSEKTTVNIILRTRLCRTCADNCLIDAKLFDIKRPFDLLLLKCVPFSTWNKDNTKFCRVQDKTAFSAKLINPGCPRQELIDKTREGVKARYKHGKACQLWLEQEVTKEEERQNNIRNIRKHAIIDRLVDLGYEEECNYLMKSEHEVIKNQAEAEITLLFKHRLVKIPKPLTAREWANIKSRMIRYIENVRDHIKAEDSLSLIAKRENIILESWRSNRREAIVNGDAMFIPSPIDVLDAFKSLAELPTSVILTDAMVRESFDKRMKTFLQDFRARALEELERKHLCIWYPSPRFELEYPCPDEGRRLHNMSLATRVWACTNDRLHLKHSDSDFDEINDNIAFQIPLFYPEYLHHPCNTVCERKEVYLKTPEDKERKRLDSNEMLYIENTHRKCRHDRWNAGNLVPHEKASRVVAEIVRACGLEIDSATVNDLDKLDPRLICLKCTFGVKANGERLCSIRTWRKAVVHCLRTHWGPVQWQMISEKDAAEVRKLEQAPRGLFSEPSIEAIWRCTYCIHLPQDQGLFVKSELLTHYRLNHRGVLEEDAHFHRALDVPPPQPQTVMFTPDAVPDELSTHER